MPQYRVQPEAADDVRAQAKYYVDRGSTDTAERWSRAALATFAAIADGRWFGERRRPRRPGFGWVRVATVIDFPSRVVIYREVPDGIEVVRVRGAREDLDRLLGPPH